MASKFQSALHELKSVAAVFDDASNERKRRQLQALRRARLPWSKALVDYVNVLMFVCAHPPDPDTRGLADAELDRVAALLRRKRQSDKARLQNSGLPFTDTLSTYSHDLLEWMTGQPGFRLQFDSFWNPTIRLADAMHFTLPSLERDVAATGLDGKALLEALVPARQGRIRFLLSQFDRLAAHPALKDYLFDGLHLYLRLRPGDRSFSKAFNRLVPAKVFYHSDKLRGFEQRELLDRRLPHPVPLTAPRAESIIGVARCALMLLQRETDPTTFLDPASLRYYELERGISIAIYGMVACRQLPLESYVGYTLFKNGYPAAYGGSWIYGRRALFGINVFEAFRGGESGFMMCQLLRVYRQVFGIDYYEVEPYQYGQGNPEGIKSGAFWFYYRHGFRPLEPALATLAAAERAEIERNRQHRSPASVLRQLAAGHIALALAGDTPPRSAEVRERVTEFTQVHYHGDRAAADADSRRAFIKHAGPLGRTDDAQNRVFSEVALWAHACNIRAPRTLALLKRMIHVKPVVVYQYQKLLLKVLR